MPLPDIPNLGTKIAHMLSSSPHSPASEAPRPVSSSSAFAQEPAPHRSGSHVSITPATLSPCQLFGLFKSMAGSPGQDAGSLDVDSDEDEEDELILASSTASIQKVERTKDEDDNQTLADHHEKHNVLGRLRSDTLGKAEQERDEMSSRFAALSMSNLSPLSIFGSDQPPKPKKRPRLPTYDSQSLAQDEMDPESPLTSPELVHSDSEVTDGSRSNASTPDTEVTPHEVTDEEKLAAIIEDFGEIAGLVVDANGVSEPERMLAESKGSLFKGIMMIGNINLTTHRILFHALLPPDEALMQSKSDDPDAFQRDILHAGPVTFHHESWLKARKRVWMELSAEMVTTYPNGDDEGRIRPIQSILLSSVARLAPFDPVNPCDFVVTYEAVDGLQTVHFTVDTEQSATMWRRAWESALFRHARSKWRRRHIAAQKGLGLEDVKDEQADSWAMMRCCIPLDRVTVQGISDFHSFATLAGLQVELDERHHVSWRPEKLAEGDFAGFDAPEKKKSFLNEPIRRSLSLHRKRRESSPAPTPKASIPSPLRTDTTCSADYMEAVVSVLPNAAPDEPHVTSTPRFTTDPELANTFTFNIAVLNEQAWFVKALEAAVHACKSKKYKPGVTRPNMVLDIAGSNCLATDDEVPEPASGPVRDSTSSSDVDRDDEDETGHHMADRTRKAEKASMAAKLFGLREDEGIWLKRCYVIAGSVPVPCRGHIILAPRFICFWRRATVGADIKYRFKVSDVKGAIETTAFRAGFFGMALQLHGFHDLRFEFWKGPSRDEVMSRINALAHPEPVLKASPISSPPLLTDEPAKMMAVAPLPGHASDILAMSHSRMLAEITVSDEAIGHLPFIANKPFGKTANLTPRTFALLTIGSRGDVQPYIALGLRLMKDKHKVVIITHEEFKVWVEGYGIEHRSIGGDPTALMELVTEHPMFSPGFFKESLGAFRQWLDDLLLDSWNACHDADVLIESPSAMAGVHIAEAKKIPYFRAFTMPWTRTNAYPQAFMVPAFEMGPSFNYSTYVLFDNIMWKATSGQINRWRKKHLRLKATDMSALSVQKVPFLYNFSSAVVPKPLDWHDDITITGYWNLENSDTEWTPSPELEAFMEKAKADGKALVYIGFGSIVVPRPNAMTKSIVRAVEKADVRAIIAKGWSSRSGSPSTEGEHIQFPDNCFGVEKIPHGWLFPKVQAAMHHGGAGTVGASLRAGIPTLIKPWFGDQFFWATRVTKLGAGMKVASLKSNDIAEALIKATTNTVMIEKAARIGEKIRSEDGVEVAMSAIKNNIMRAVGDRTKMQWAK
ncbi:hypothetical protein P7C73_g2755, partial [Tremellales sp. Uapishka_1]